MRNRVFIKERRQIRVFISSSFENMDEERNYLRDVVVHRIQEKARKRAVAVTALDLRWGIPEGTDLGKTIEICMNEIDNSFPFFIGIVGGSYGSQPDKKEVFDSNKVLQEQYSALCKYFEMKMSITEMEMRYGVLDCDEEERRKINALFLTKKEDIETIRKDSRLNGLNCAIKACGENFEESKITHDGKNHIWSSDYSSIEEFGKIIELVFDDILDRLFPEDKELDSYQQQLFMQEAVLAELSRFYIPDSKIIDAINNFITDSSKQKLLITGERGCGKSSLLAYWISRYSTEYQKDGVDIIYHFVGSGESENNTKKIEDHILRALSDLGVETEEKEKDGNTKKKSLVSLLRKDCLRDQGRIVIIVDAVDQLQASQGFSLLRQKELPRDTNLILSTVIKDETESVIRKSMPDEIITLAGLTKELQRRNVIDSYLKDFHGRNLGEKNIEKVIRWPQSQNPLALMTLLNELLVAGKYDKMDVLVDNYIRCQSIDSLFDLILVRMKNCPDYSWIDIALGAIALSRYGLSEDELLRIIPSHILYWSSFYCFFQRHFFVRNGLITFAHQYFRKAVERTCISDKEVQKQIHTLLIHLFEKGHTARDQEELLYHYFALGDFQSLFSLASDPCVFRNMWQIDGNSFICYWERLISEGYSPSALLINNEQYQEIWNDLNERNNGFHMYCGDLESLLSKLHQYELSVKIFQIHDEYISKDGEDGSIHRKRYTIIANVYSEIGELEKAIQLYKQSFWEMSGCLDERRHLFKVGFDENNPRTDGYNIELYIAISSCYRRLGQYDNAQKYLDLAKRCMYLPVEHDKEQDGYASYMLDKEQDEYASYMLEYLRLMADNGYYPDRHFSTKMARTETWAELYSFTRQYPKSISYWHKYIKGLKGYFSSITGVNAAVAYQQIAGSLINLGKYRHAEHFINVSFNCVANREKNEYLEAKNNLQLGLILYIKREYASSLDYYLNALDTLERMELWPEWLEACQDTANIATWNKKTQFGLDLLNKALDIVERKHCCTDFQKAQLLWTLSGLEFNVRDYHNSFEHAHSAFINIAGKRGPHDTQVLKIIKRLDDSLIAEPSLFNDLNSTYSGSFTIWDKYVLLSQNRTLSQELKAQLCCCGYISDSTSWRIANDLLNNCEEQTIIDILESENEDAFYDNILCQIEKTYDSEFLQRVFMTIILSRRGIEEQWLISNLRRFPQEMWDSLKRQYNALFGIHNGKLCLTPVILEPIIISHYFKYKGRGSEIDIMMRFAEELAPQYKCSLFSKMEEKRYIRELQQDSDNLKQLISQIDDTSAQQKVALFPVEVINIVSKYYSSRDDIFMILGLCSYEAALPIKGLEDELTQNIAQLLQQCVNFKELPAPVRGSVSLVLGLKAYNDKDYTSALSSMYNYYSLSYKNDSLDNKLRWYQVIEDCFINIDSFEWDSIVPVKLVEEWQWEAYKYKYLKKDILTYFSVSNISENKKDNMITIVLNEKTKRTFQDNTPNRFRFLRQAIETRIVFRDAVQVSVYLRRAVWYDLKDNCEVLNIYAIKNSKGILKDFNTYIKAVFKYIGYSMTDTEGYD